MTTAKHPLSGLATTALAVATALASAQPAFAAAAEAAILTAVAPKTVAGSAASSTPATVTPKGATSSKPAARPPSVRAQCADIRTGPVINLAVGKSHRYRPDAPVARIVMGNPAGSDSKTGAASVDALLLSPNEIYLQARSQGSTNLLMLGRNGQCTMLDVAVGADPSPLQGALDTMLPGLTGKVRVTPAAGSLILSGTVRDAPQADKVAALAAAFAGGPGKVINMLGVEDPQQVMLEVKVAEVSKTLLDKIGINLSARITSGDWTYRLLSDFLSGGSGAIGGSHSSGNRSFTVDGQKDDGLVKILAEPTVMALSGQKGSFLAGGKILIPVSQSNQIGGTTVTLEEKEFGVGLSFTPTVLDEGKINLVVTPEVSELSREGVSLVTNSGASVLPLITTRRANTTVQLRDGQSFAIGGLVKNNVTTNISAFPFLGELPILGALFRSSSFQTDKSELLFVITPRLVKPLPADYKLPTDNYIAPNRAQLFLGGKLEGIPPRDGTPAEAPATRNATSATVAQ